MYQTLQSKQIATNNVQICPLCGMPQEGFVNGITVINNEIIISKDKWYSFCNCHNIFFTKWENMEQAVYDENYQNKYQGAPINTKVNSDVKDFFFQLPVKTGMFTEVGVVTDFVMDLAHENGFQCFAVDINPNTKTIYPLITGSLDDVTLPNSDVFWFSHVIEHTKNPISVMKKAYNSLNEGGAVYISMPDPWFIPWENPYLWAHWHHKEHHILWDMDSFIDMCIALGFNLHFSKRRAFGADFHVILTKGIK